MRYPADIDKSTDFMSFQIGKYKSPVEGPTAGQTVSSSYQSQPAFTKTNGEIAYLNMPDSIGSTFTGAWAGKTTTALAQAALGGVGRPLGQVMTDGKLTGLDFATVTETANKAAAAFGTDIATALASALGQVPGLGGNLTANDILQIATETIINPNTELLYGGPGLRTHGYTFKLIPQSKSEATEILKIVNMFKKACLPENNIQFFGKKTRNFIGIPDICEIKFMSRSSDGTIIENPHLPKYKYSAFTSVSTNYITDNQYMSYRDGEPIGISLTILMSELKLVFREDLINNVAR